MKRTKVVGKSSSIETWLDFATDSHRDPLKAICKRVSLSLSLSLSLSFFLSLPFLFLSPLLQFAKFAADQFMVFIAAV